MPLVAGGATEPDFVYQFTIDQPKCKEDADRDNVQLSCDNAPNVFNPDQGDIDGDGFGDVIDLCPTLPTAVANTADSDKDGVGNECDDCRQTLTQYNHGTPRCRSTPTYRSATSRSRTTPTRTASATSATTASGRQLRGLRPDEPVELGRPDRVRQRPEHVPARRRPRT